MSYEFVTRDVAVADLTSLAQEAGAGVSPDMVAQLGETELEQMRYWNSQRIGDVIFNYWD